MKASMIAWILSLHVCPTVLVTGLLLPLPVSSHGKYANRALHMVAVEEAVAPTIAVPEEELEDEATRINAVPEVLLSSTTTSELTFHDNDWWSLWLRRLKTSEDAFSVHKLSALVYTATSFTMMGTAATRWLMGRQDLFAALPDYMEPLMYLFCLSNLSMCLASIRMAWLYRRNDLASRNAFVGTAGSSIFSGYFLLWASPFAPDWLTAPLASQIGFGTLCAWNIVFVADTMIRAKDNIDGRRSKSQDEDNIDGRRSKSQDEDDASFTLEYLRYIASGAWGLPVVAVTGYISSIQHDHSWLMNVFDHVFASTGHGIQASVFYNNVLASMAAAYGSLFVTLRDKKLISKSMEWGGIVAFAIPALLWTIDVTARIVPYWTGGITDVVL